MSSPFINAALKVAETYSVFPTVGKAPAWSNKELGVAKGKGGYHTATKAKTVIKDQFMRGTCIGVPCRMNGIVVVDVDLYKGEHVVKWHEENYHLLKDTLCHRSGNGGLHYIFRDPGGKLPGTVARDVDLKCNGYINWAGAGGYEAVNDLPIQPYPVFDAKPNGKGPSGVYSDGLSTEDLVQQVIRAQSFHPALRTLSARMVANHQLGGDEVEKLLLDLMDESEAKSIQHPEHERWADRRSKVPELAQSAAAKFDPVPAGIEVIDATAMLQKDIEEPEPEEEPEPVEPAVVAPLEPSMPPGLVGRVAAFSASHGVRQAPLADIVAGLMSMAALNANRAVIERNGRITSLNLYTMLIAPSGAGKENPRTVVQILVEAMAGVSEVAYWSELASHPALLRGLLEVKSHAAVLAMDEAGKYLRTAANVSNGHSYQLVTEIMKLYGMALKTLPERRYADGKNTIQPIERPYLNVLGTTVLEALTPALKSEDVVNGMLNRFLIFEMPYGDENMTGNDAVPADLLKDLTTLLQKLKQGERVVMLKPAQKLMEAWRDEIEVHMRAGEPLWQRTFENTLKLAGIVALGDGGKVKAEHAKWAVDCAKWCQHNLEHTVAGQIVAEDQLQVQLKIENHLRKKGEKTRRQLQQLCVREGRKVFGEALDTLLDAGILTQRKEGRKTLIVLRRDTAG